MQIDIETESHNALALRYAVQNKKNSLSIEGVLSNGKSLLGDPSERTAKFIGVEPGEYFWTYEDRIDVRLNRRTYEKITVFNLKQGDLFSVWRSDIIQSHEKLLVTCTRKHISVHDSTTFFITVINTKSGKQINANNLGTVTRYRPTKEEEILLIPYLT